MKNNFKKSLCILIALIIVFTSLLTLPLTAFAENLSGSNSSIMWKISKDGLLEISRNSSSETVKIPDYSLNKRPGWYKYSDRIKSIKIGTNITRIGNYAFYGLTNAKDVTIGKNISEIGTASFGHCNSLKSFTVVDGNKSYITSSNVLYNLNKTTIIAFPANKNVEKFVIPSTVTTIKGYAFHYAKHIKEITQKSASVKSINSHTFANCAILEKVTIKNNCTTLGDKCLYNCKNLHSVTVPPSVTSIGSDILLPGSNLKKLTVHCAYDSPIHQYLKNKGGYAITNKSYKFKCNFEAGNGAEITEKSRNVTWGSEYGTLPTPVKSGYSFAGWFLGSKQIHKNTKVDTAKDHTLIAHYNGKTYTIALNPENGNCDTKNLIVKYGQPYGKLPEASKVGYEFLGWYTEKGEKIYTDSLFLDDSITTLYARYRKNVNPTTGLKIRYKSKNSITLLWDVQKNVTGYEVYKKTGSGSYILFRTVKRNTVDIKLSPKKAYKFKVRAFVSEGDSAQYGAYSSVVYRARTFVKKPKIRKSASNGILSVKWKSISNAKKYQIYQYKNKKWKKVKTTTATKFYVHIKANKKYKFKVCGYTTVLKHKYYGAFKKITYKT